MDNKLFMRAKAIEKEIAVINEENRILKQRIEILWTATEVQIVAQPYVKPDDEYDMSFTRDLPKPLIFSIDQYLVANYLKELIKKNEWKIIELEEEFKAL